jgi:hypothetical protein
MVVLLIVMSTRCARYGIMASFPSFRITVSLNMTPYSLVDSYKSAVFIFSFEELLYCEIGGNSFLQFHGNYFVLQ